MAKWQIATQLAERFNLTKTRGEELVDAVLGEIAHELDTGGECRLGGFGTFSAEQRPARKGRNPRTGEEIEIAASRAVRFRAAKPLRDRLNPTSHTVTPTKRAARGQ